jgi:hypothetical protein
LGAAAAAPLVELLSNLLLRERDVVLELALRLKAHLLGDLSDPLPLAQPRLRLCLEDDSLDLGLEHVVVLPLQQVLQLRRVEHLGQRHL